MQQREQEFLHRIRRDPANDDLRLVFADWLDEMGDDRSELIRVQCETSRLNACDNTSPSQELLEHERELTQTWQRFCLEELASLGVKDLRFERGFIQRMLLEGTTFLHRTKTLEEWAPTLEGVLWQKIPRQSASPIQKFFEAPVFSALKSINLMRNNLGTAGVEALAGSANLTSVQSLSLRENTIGGQSMKELAHSPFLSGVQRLDLTQTHISPVDASWLSGAETLFHLEELLLSHNQIGDAGLRSLSQNPQFHTLRTLTVAENQIAQEGVRALADSPHLTDLRVLDLSGNDLGDASLSLIASASNYARLAELKLVGCGIQKSGLMALAESPYLTKLTTLDLSLNPSVKGLPPILESRVLRQLQNLTLRHCGLDSQSVRPLLGISSDLARLDLRDNPLINPYTKDMLREQFGSRVVL